MTFAPMLPEHWPAVRAIYLEGIATGHATFQQTAPDWDEWDAGHLPTCRLVALDEAPDEAPDEANVTGWAALSAISRRPVYAGVAEVSVYVAERARGKGVGKELLAQLIRQSEQVGFWTLQAGIFPENIASIGLHKSHGFRLVGIRDRLGRMNGRWRDVCLLERRSPLIE
jgi:L-amino acid N-acyltransferase YncA